MAHEITSTDNMVSTQGVVPWHGLGTVVKDKALSAIDALELAKLNWEVQVEPVYDADMNEVDYGQIVRRMDNREILAVVGKQWTPVQNTYLLEIAEAIAQADNDKFKPVIETAGSLKGGRHVWALVQVGETIMVDQQHKSYLLLSNNHAGISSFRGTHTDVRVVCNNTLSMAERAESCFAVRHTRNAAVHVDEAIRTLGWSNDMTDMTRAVYENMALTNLHKDEAIDFFSTIAAQASKSEKANDRDVQQLEHLYLNGLGNSGQTAYDALNAVTDWVDHHRDLRGTDPERRMNFATFGKGDLIKKKALNLLTVA